MLEPINTTKRNKKKYILWSIVLIAVGFICYYYIRNLDFEKLIKLSTLSGQTYIYIIILFIICNGLIIFYNWYLLRSLRISVNSFRLGMIIWISQTSNILAMAKIGIPVRIILMKKILDVPYASSISAKLIVTWLMLCTVALAGVIGSAWGFGLPEGWRENILLGGFLILVAGVSLPFLIRLIRIRESKQTGFLMKVLRYIGEVSVSIRSVPVKNLLVVFLSTVVQTILMALVAFIIINSISGQKVDFLSVWAVQSVNAIVALISFVPMGLGTKDLSLLFLYGQLGVSREAALILAAYERLIWTLLPFILGVVSGIITGISPRKIKSPQEGLT